MQKKFIMNPLLVYSGKHVFHFTGFESALKILATKSLQFGFFENMNDIAEVKKDVYGFISSDLIRNELSLYQSISLTKDKRSNRGFYIDPLWGHYAQKGNGVCFVFDFNKLKLNVKNQFGEKAIIKPIKYLSKFSNAIFTEGNTREAIIEFIKGHIEEIFFTKSIDWKYEQEIRIVINADNTFRRSLYWKDSLIAVIICLPRVEKYKESSEYKILKSLLVNIPILYYTTSLGNKKVVDENGEKVCDIIGVDLQILFE